MLTHHPEDAPPSGNITFLSCPVDEAVRIALDAADGKNYDSPDGVPVRLGLVGQPDPTLAVNLRYRLSR